MTSTEAITLATSVAALLTGAATLLTVIELRRQRQSTHRADLVVLPRPFALLPSSNSWMIAGVDDSMPDGLDLPRYWLDLVNIGAGPAKNVRIKWEADLLKMAELIIDASEDNEWRVWVDKRSAEIATPHESRRVHFLDSQMRDHRPVLSASPGAQAQSRLELPPAYLDIVALHLGVSLSADRKDRSYYFEPPVPIRLHVEYADIEGFQYRKEFAIHPELFSFQSPPDSSGSGAGSGEMTVRQE